METAVKINNIKKSYEGVEAVRGVSLDIRKGEMFGLVGPDGAGKTSLIRMLCGLILPDSGSAGVFERDVVKEREKVQESIGYLSQKFSLYGDLSIDENIEFFADIHGVKNYRERRDELLRFTRLIDFRKRQADRLSGGMKQKLALACSLIHRPDLLLLDEPTTGVDPVSRRDFWKILSTLLKEGMTIILTTPYLDEAERTGRVALMNKGRIVSLDEPDAIKKSIDKKVIELICSPVRNAYEIISRNFDYDIQLFGDRVNVIVSEGEEEYKKIEAILKENEIRIEEYRIVPPSLENVFIYKVKESYN